ncbi:MAG: hypothetical protein JNK67_13870 [Alphaproteobacteria bacterium]|nr:hypothetical protein [Alphaproteobacteria bacterium]
MSESPRRCRPREPAAPPGLPIFQRPGRGLRCASRCRVGSRGTPAMDALEATYATLRSHVLARHFAVGRYFPAYHFGNGHVLGEFAACRLPRAGTVRIGCAQDGCVPRTWRRRRNAEPEMVPHYATAAALRALREPRQSIERWRVWRRDRTNALLMSGMRIAGLAVEHRLGSGDAAAAMERWLDTTETLFKFRHSSGPMQGYVVRWDAATSDRWEAEVDRAGVEAPVLPCEFLLDPDPRRDKARPFLNCTAARDSRYAAALRVQDGQDRWRRWEPSMDEYVGLVVAYLSIFDALADDLPATGPRRSRAERIIAKVKVQTGRVARYLQAHAYVMVRPCGGVTIRGAGETNPCMAYAFSRAFERILGQAFPVTATFDDAMRIAGLSDCLSRSADLPDPAQAIASLRDGQIWQRLVGLFGADPLAELAAVLPDANGSFRRAARLRSRDACFDVLAADAETAGEQFALCSLLCDYARVDPAGAWTRFMAAPQKGAHDYKVVAGLIAISTGDELLRDSYMAYFRGAMRTPAVGLTRDPEALAGGSQREMALPTAIALHLRRSGTPTQASLRRDLARDLGAMTALLADRFASQPLVVEDADGIGYAATEPEGQCCAAGDTAAPSILFEYADKVGSWHGYMAAVALAWWHAKLMRGASPWRDIVEPSADSVAKWPEPKLPAAVAGVAAAERIILPPSVLARAGRPARDVAVLAAAMPAKPDDDQLPSAEPQASRIVGFRQGPHLGPRRSEVTVTVDVPPPRADTAYLEHHELVATVANLDAFKADVPAPIVDGSRVTLTITLYGAADPPRFRFAHANGELVCAWLPRQSLR